MRFTKFLTILCLWAKTAPLHSKDFETMLNEERRLYKINTIQEQKKIDELDYLFQTRKDIPATNKTKKFVEFKPGMRPHELKIGFIHSELLQLFHPHRLFGKNISDPEIKADIQKETTDILKENEISLIFDENFCLKNQHGSPASTYSSLNPKRISLTEKVMKRLFQKYKTPAETQKQVLDFLKRNIFDLE